MKTLNEVIKAFEVCMKEFENCIGCPYASETGEPLCCGDDKEDALHYLKEYQMLQIAYIKAMADLEENPPLTWDELTQMKGKPVWVEYNIHIKNKECQDMSKIWDIIDHFGTFMDNPVFFTEKGFLFEKEKQGVQWQAYRKERE